MAQICPSRVNDIHNGEATMETLHSYFLSSSPRVGNTLIESIGIDMPDLVPHQQTSSERQHDMMLYSVHLPLLPHHAVLAMSLSTNLSQWKVYINIRNGPHYSSNTVLFIHLMSKTAHTRSQDHSVTGRGDLSSSLTSGALL